MDIGVRNHKEDVLASAHRYRHPCSLCITATVTVRQSDCTDACPHKATFRELGEQRCARVAEHTGSRQLCLILHNTPTIKTTPASVK